MSEFELTVIHADEVTAVEVVFWGAEDVYRTTGAAKRHPDDEDDRALGETLAMSRALKQLSADLEKDARKAVAKADDKRRRAAAAAAVDSLTVLVDPGGLIYQGASCSFPNCTLCRPRG